jgi:hypothetical protein
VTVLSLKDGFGAADGAIEKEARREPSGAVATDRGRVRCLKWTCDKRYKSKRPQPVVGAFAFMGA